MFKLMRFSFFVICLFVLSSTVVHAQVEIPDPQPGDIVAELFDADGNGIGMAMVTPMLDMDEAGGEALLVAIAVWQGLEPGFHAVHIHSVGICEHDTDSPFTSAAGHFNPTDTTHGEHVGDLPSLFVLGMGGGGVMFITDAFTIDDLLDEDGSAFMIHAGRDNYGNIPERYGAADEQTLAAGDAGARVVCGVAEIVDE